MPLYRVVPPEGLALPDIHPSIEAAYAFYRMHYHGEATEHHFNWYWLETVRPMVFGDFIVHSVLAGLMKEEMAAKGIDDSHLPDDLADTFESIARMSINEYAAELGIEIPGWIVEDRRRVDSPE